MRKASKGVLRFGRLGIKIFLFQSVDNRIYRYIYVLKKSLREFFRGDFLNAVFLCRIS